MEIHQVDGKAARERHQAHVQEALNREKEARVLSSKRFVGVKLECVGLCLFLILTFEV